MKSRRAFYYNYEILVQEHVRYIINSEIGLYSTSKQFYLFSINYFCKT